MTTIWQFLPAMFGTGVVCATFGYLAGRRPRLHSGGVVLRQDEYPAILSRGGPIIQFDDAFEQEFAEAFRERQQPAILRTRAVDRLDAMIAEDTDYLRKYVSIFFNARIPKIDFSRIKSTMKFVPLPEREDLRRAHNRSGTSHRWSRPVVSTEMEAECRRLCREQNTGECAAICLTHMSTETHDGHCPEAVLVWHGLIESAGGIEPVGDNLLARLMPDFVKPDKPKRSHKRKTKDTANEGRKEGEDGNRKA